MRQTSNEHVEKGMVRYLYIIIDFSEGGLEIIGKTSLLNCINSSYEWARHQADEEARDERIPLWIH